MKVLLIVSILIFSLFSCGQNDSSSGAESSISSLVPSESEVLSSAELNLLRAQYTGCEPNLECPESIAKLIVFKRGEDRDEQRQAFCTGVLISKDMILTSSTCLGNKVINGSDCHRVFALFPRVRDKEATASQCIDLLSTTSPAQWAEGKKNVWRNDFAILRFKEVNSRTPLPINLNGIQSQDYSMWGLQQENEVRGIIRKQDCHPLFNSYANVFAQNPFSPFIPFEGCEFDTQDLFSGSSGAAIVSSAGKLSGVVSSSLSEDKIRLFKEGQLLYDGEVNPIVHVTNLSCINFPGRTLQNTSECLKTINRVELDKEQKKLINNPELYIDSKKLITDSILNLNPFFDFDIDFVDNSNLEDDGENSYLASWLEPVLRMKCFKNYQSWIDKKMFRNPILWWLHKKKTSVYAVHNNWKIIKKFDRSFYPVILYTQEEGRQEYRIEFSPRSLKKKGESYLYFHIPPLTGRDPDPTLSVEEFDSMGDCQILSETIID